MSEPPDTAPPAAAPADANPAGNSATATSPEASALPRTAPPETAPPETTPPEAAQPEPAQPEPVRPEPAQPGAAGPPAARPAITPPDTASPDTVPKGATGAPGAVPKPRRLAPETGWRLGPVIWAEAGLMALFSLLVIIFGALALDSLATAAAVALLIVTGALVFGLRRAVIQPVSRLAADVRQVADGDFSHQVGQSGPAEVRGLGADVNRMRERILAELSAATARTRDLQRSNAELEQFAYVASHDLQEPLRKVASFCQLLQARYAGQLDERADEYIEHAVDGAKRMQVLINDLLAFSRVGRTAQKRVPVSCAALLAQAWANLATAASQTRVTIEAGDLPVVLGEASLLTAVFQNLLSNALKFRSGQPPHVAVSARQDDGFWLFTFADNGIGIEPEYAERVFVIFQRLHDRASYPGTGIGLAMCRKIIEYHGGKIWLDTSAPTGARFCFTLPVLPEGKDADG